MSFGMNPRLRFFSKIAGKLTLGAHPDQVCYSIGYLIDSAQPQCCQPSSPARERTTGTVRARLLGSLAPRHCSRSQSRLGRGLKRCRLVPIPAKPVGQESKRFGIQDLFSAEGGHAVVGLAVKSFMARVV